MYGDDEEDEILEPNFEKLSTYEDYLDFYVTWKDLYYLKSDEAARTIVTLGYRIPELLSRDQFDDIIAQMIAEREEKKKDETYLAKELELSSITCPLMGALAAREKANRTGYESCIIFIRDVNKKGQEISGYIDFKARLDKEQMTWLDYYASKKKLTPNPSDLCFYNWATFYCSCNSSENYAIVTDVKNGLRFMNKIDRKIITVNPFGYVGDNTFRTGIVSPNYIQCALYDHSMRAKNASNFSVEVEQISAVNKKVGHMEPIVVDARVTYFGKDGSVVDDVTFTTDTSSVLTHHELETMTGRRRRRGAVVIGTMNGDLEKVHILTGNPQHSWSPSDPYEVRAWKNMQDSRSNNLPYNSRAAQHPEMMDFLPSSSMVKVDPYHPLVKTAAASMSQSHDKKELLRHHRRRPQCDISLQSDKSCKIRHQNEMDCCGCKGCSLL